MNKKFVEHEGISPEFKELVAAWDGEHVLDIDYLYISTQMEEDEFKHYVQTVCETGGFNQN